MTISLFNAERLCKGRPFTIILNKKKYRGTLYEDYRVTEIYRKSLHAYGMRHPDDDLTVPATVTPGYPMVNFFGTFVTNKELPIIQETEIDSWSEAS